MPLMPSGDLQRDVGARPRSRRTQARVARHDEAIRAAAVRVLAQRGWDKFTKQSVAQASGLSEGAVYRRYATARDIGMDVWSSQLAPTLGVALDRLFAAVGDVGNGAADLPAALRSFLYAGDPLLASIEVLLASGLDPELHELVTASLSTHLSPVLPSSNHQDAVDAARHAAALVAALGLVMTADRPWLATCSVGPAIDRLRHAIDQPSAVIALPPDRPEFLTQSPFETGDPRRNRVMECMAASVGSLGYARSFLAPVARAAGVDVNYISQNFGNKLDLFLALIDHQHDKGWNHITQFFAEQTQIHGAGVAEAIGWLAYLAPNIGQERVVALESYRLTMFNDRMRSLVVAKESENFKQIVASGPPSTPPAELFGHMHLELCFGIGLLVTAILLPEAWRFPFVTVTTPLKENDPFVLH